jgi:hypothetical protein
LLPRVSDERDRGADLDGLTLGDENLLDGSRRARRNLGVDLVGRDLDDVLVGLDRVALLLEPLGDGALDDGLAELRHLDLGSHCPSSGCTDRRSTATMPTGHVG